ncbi:MAG: ATP-binding cassette domain-containing protein [Streptosporangiales bacterium]|nr:ATP-binding cassette domain-containing protein [Streptosporangiales bacterium]
MTGAMTAELRLDDVSWHFGRVKAVDGVSLAVERGARHAVIGPNGAGKTTLFGVVAGTLRPSAGRVLVGGRDVTRLSEHARARLGVVRTFQHSSVFLSMTALDNVALAVQRVRGVGTRLWLPARRYVEVTERALGHLESVGLADRAGESAATLSHGERRQLEVAVALAARPRLLLLDEPTAGMSVEESSRFTDVIRELPVDVTVLVIEHDLDVVFRLASHVTVLHLGRVLADGTPEEVRDSEEVQRAYLGAADSSELFFSPEEERT